MGATIASTLAALLLAGFYLEAQHFSWHFIHITWAFCYGIIWFFTKKTKKNSTIMFLAILSTIAAFGLAVVFCNVCAPYYIEWAR